MLKKSSLIIILFFPVMAIITAQLSLSERLHGFGTVAYAQNLPFDFFSGNEVIERYSHLSAQQLLDTANHYYYKNCFDTALVCYTLIVNTPVKDTDVEGQKKVIEALNRSGVIYHRMCNYRKSYELLIQALDLCEKYRYDRYKLRIYTNTGNIYYHFSKYDMAKVYYSKALSLCGDSADMAVILNNLGAVELESGKSDSAFYFLNQSLQISRQYHDIHIHIILNTMASMYRKSGVYDSAFHYSRLALNEAKKNHKIEFEAASLSGLGELFSEIGKTDSALHYLNLSNSIAEENSLLNILAENSLALSGIEESKGYHRNALEYFKKYANLQDSILDVKVFSEINQLQRLYEVSKTNRRIEQLAVEQKIKDRTIRYQKIIQFITLGVLLLVSGVLLFVFFQKRKLNKAYRALFEKNLKIIELQDSSSGRHHEKYRKSALTDNMQQALLDRILALLEDTSIACDPKFSIDRLAELVQSNHNYVSQVINNALKKNFRSFLNSYRIQEALRLFSEQDAAKYTIESVALRVGFMSQNSFRNAFKEFTGVSPNFYLKSIREQKF